MRVQPKPNRIGTYLGMLPPCAQAVQKLPHPSLLANQPFFAQHLVLGGDRGNSLVGGPSEDPVDTRTLISEVQGGWDGNRQCGER